MSEMNEASLRTEIKKMVADYYEQIHRPKNERPFDAETNSRVNYAGRVFDEKEMLNLTDALLDFWLTSGRFYEEFETKFAAKLGVKYCLLVNSGSSANLVAFSALTSHLLKDRRVKPGDEVITVAAGFPTTVNPIIQCGAVPVFVDVRIDDGTYNIDVDAMERALSPKTRAVMIAHTLGNPFDLGRVKAFCDANKLWLIEDNCDALGSKYDGKYTGTFGDLATSSFYPPHHITMGEGGAVYTSNPILKRAAESFRDWGRDCWCPSGKDNTCGKRFNWRLGSLPKGYDHKYTYSHVGYNLKATEMQAAIGVAQIDKLDHFITRRRENFAYLRESFADLEESFILPEPTPASEPSWFGFMLTCKPGLAFTRDELLRHLEAKNIQTRMLFAGNLLRQPAMASIVAQPGSHRVVGSLENTDRVAENAFWLGVYPGLTQPALQYMVTTLKDFVRERRS